MMNLTNKKGAALMQVLLVTVILAGMATMLLRAMLSRTVAAKQTRKSVSAQMLTNSCMAEVNMLWSSKKPEIFSRDLRQGIMYCSTAVAGDCPAASRRFELPCTTQTIDGNNYQVTAYFQTNDSNNPRKDTKYSSIQAGLIGNSSAPDAKREIIYEITTGSANL